ncbi:hypothetical protein DH2020_049099 [Rehmannia glutinosa]|uniref:Uncharacterized protein n=1 Tax=Rehmannia glutinosa TaxID=99300 RepID=A0ABR0U522_REHGL
MTEKRWRWSIGRRRRDVRKPETPEADPPVRRTNPNPQSSSARQRQRRTHVMEISDGCDIMDSVANARRRQRGVRRERDRERDERDPQTAGGARGSYDFYTGEFEILSLAAMRHERLPIEEDENNVGFKIRRGGGGSIGSPPPGGASAAKSTAADIRGPFLCFKECRLIYLTQFQMPNDAFWAAGRPPFSSIGRVTFICCFD